ncbi:MAG TPA: GSCFA domain-containing protein [Rhizomicrobium sp.]|nr:GSCFA domain-containing protein [Rhizomicrobium sp.]
MKSPYEELSAKHFWRTGVSESHPLTVTDLYRKKFTIRPTDGIGAGGSCFAQHVTEYLRKNGFSVMNAEPAPPALSAETARRFGYGIYSARYGNIYTARQLLQLAKDAMSGDVDAADVWTRDGRYYDALRPNVEPDGFESLEETLALRRDHLAKVKTLFAEMNVFIFTFGLTEAWTHAKSGRVYPTAPGTIAGEYDPDEHVFKNFGFNEIYNDFVEFHDLVRKANPDVKIILTVSPVPLTATASDDHVLAATTYSKSVLRAVAGALAQNHANIDYFPSYEMIASPFSKGFFYDSNMRTVNSGGVAAVMRIFFDQHKPAQAEEEGPRAGRWAGRRERRHKEGRRAQKQRTREEEEEDAVCEDALLEGFAP